MDMALMIDDDMPSPEAGPDHAFMGEAQQAQQVAEAIIPFAIEGLDIRGRFLRLDRELAKLLGPHKLPGAVNQTLGETLVLSATLASTLKFDGVFTLQTQSDGPVSMIIADMTSSGDLRGYARYDSERLDRYGRGVSFPTLMGAGYLAFTVDPGGDLERYQGIVPMEGTSMTACIQDYFRQSEQLETAIAVFSDVDRDQGPIAAALMIQRLPEQSDKNADINDDDWRRAVALMSSVTRSEMLDPDLRHEDLIYRLFHEDGVRLFDARPVRQGCRCSAKKVSATLQSFPKADILDMADDGIISVVCEFCKKDYRFAVDDLEKPLEVLC